MINTFAKVAVTRSWAKSLTIQSCQKYFRRIHHLEAEVAASGRPISHPNVHQLQDTAL